MKSIQLFKPIWTVLISILFISAGKPDCSNTNFVFQDGEKVVYKVYYNWKSVWIGAGEATFEVNPTMLNGRKHHHVVVEGKTFRKYDLFYKVRDTYESFIDAETMLTSRFKRDVYEGGYTIYNDYVFDRQRNRVVVEAEDFKTKRHRDTFNLEGCAQDVLSAIYHTRNVDYSNFRKGDTIPVQIFIDKKFYDLHLKYLGKEIIKTKLGSFRCVKVSPLLIDGRIFNETEAMNIYVTDDDNRIPVYVESPISVGSVKVLLTEYHGLRNPVTSLVD